MFAIVSALLRYLLSCLRPKHELALENLALRRQIAVLNRLAHKPRLQGKDLLRDRDLIYGLVFVRRVEGMGINQKLISPRSPWQNPYVERLVGSIRGECLNRVVVFNERQMRHVLESYFEYYHEVRSHRGLSHDSPIPRPVELPERGDVIEIPLVGGLHHHQLREAA
jgi:putative transposase